MSKTHLIVELGSSNTYIYKIGSGLLLAEPSLVATKYGSDELFAVGADAKKLIGKTNEAITVISPIERGVVVNKQMAQEMFSEFYNKVMPNKSLFNSVDVVLCISNGLTDNQIEDFKEVIYSVGIGNIKTILSSVVSLVGADINMATMNDIYAAGVSKDITLNFGQHGVLGKALNRYIPFFNASL